jgi:hypothetical protein
MPLINFLLKIIDAHRGGGRKVRVRVRVRGRVNIGPHQVNFKTRVNKNPIKPEIGGPPGNFG